MPEGENLSKLELKLRAARRAKEAQARIAESENPVWDADLIPDTSSGDAESRRNLELDAAIGKIGVVEAYTRWIGKSKIKASAKGESVMISCPFPDHEDKNPSAWMNTGKNVWNCARCDKGGDVYTLAAIHWEFDLSTYQEGANFHELRKKMAQDFGYIVQEIPGSSVPEIVPPVEEKDLPTELPASAETIQDDTHADVRNHLDWEILVEPDSFLEKYMECCAPDDTPDEYNFWNGLIAIGLAVGRDVILVDRKPVLGNLFVCLLGPTSDGKSRSFYHLQELIRAALPYKLDGLSKGTRTISSPASAEALIKQFEVPIYDPIDHSLAGYAPVRGLVDFNELSVLIGKGARVGNVIKPALMEFYDGSKEIKSVSATNGERKAENAFASVFTTTQPDALSSLLGDYDVASGFLNRWVFASGTPKRQIAIGGFEVDVTPAVEPLQKIRGWAGFGRKINWSEEALQKFTEYFDEILLPTKRADATGVLGRIDLLAKKLILLLAINGRHAEVPLEVVEKVISMTAYILRSYGITSSRVGRNEYTQLENDILYQIKRKHTEGGISAKLLKSNLVRKYTAGIINKMLKELVDSGEVLAFQIPGSNPDQKKRGPAAIRYFIARD